MLSFLLLSALAPPDRSVVLGGDLMLNGIPPSRQPLAALRPLFEGADVAVANLEIPLTNATTRTRRKSAEEIRKRDQWVLKAAPGHASGLAKLGLDLVSLGNNHTMDFGPAGLAEMTSKLDEQGIGYTGAGSAKTAYEVAVYEASNGERIGMISALAFLTPAALRKCSPATPSEPGVAVLSFGGVMGALARNKIQRWVRTAKEECDVLIVGLHWGIEKKTVPTPYQVALGRAFVDAGADVVWGHHPHVLQGGELYRGKPILYSMGNLVSPTPADTAVARLVYRNGQLADVEWTPVRIRGGRAVPLSKAEAAPELRRIDGLHAAFRARYPHPQSAPLP